ncbi:MAG: hypothetical protein AAF492_30115, partial [Verrucomicrobiota bacterium]
MKGHTSFERMRLFPPEHRRDFSVFLLFSIIWPFQGPFLPRRELEADVRPLHPSAIQAEGELSAKDGSDCPSG